MTSNQVKDREGTSYWQCVYHATNKFIFQTKHFQSSRWKIIFETSFKIRAVSESGMLCRHRRVVGIKKRLHQRKKFKSQNCIALISFHVPTPLKVKVGKRVRRQQACHYMQGLKNALVCSSVTRENFKFTSKKFSRAVSVQYTIFLFFLQLIHKWIVFGINE
jgi:hypothetical protein